MRAKYKIQVFLFVTDDNGGISRIDNSDEFFWTKSFMYLFVQFILELQLSKQLISDKRIS